MGTNYYLHKSKGKKVIKEHLGKSSTGWRFLFHKTKNTYNLTSFLEYIQTGIIYNEYGDCVDLYDFLEIIKPEPNEKHHTDSQIERIDNCDFLTGDFF